MILVTRLNGSSVYLNAELVQSVEPTPDTVITLISEKKLIVRETAEEVVHRMIDYQRKIHQPFASATQEKKD